MLQTNNSRYKYTPDEMPEDEFLKRFVVREKVFEEIFKDIKASDYEVSNQHFIIVGQRGQGKTTLLRKILIETKKDKNLSKFLIPVKFAEEQYQIRSLSRLWEEVADYLQSIYEDIFPNILDDMEEFFDDEDYELKAFSYFEKHIKKQNKKLLILVDNIDELIGKFSEKEQRRFREILLTSSSFRIIGGSTKMLEQHYDYSKPFYEFFKIVKLKGFNSEESKKFLLSYANTEEKKKIKEVIENTPERLEVIRQLTGGVPRTLVMLFDIFLDEEGTAFDDLLKILDEVTPLYKHRMDDLPAQLQELVHTIAINWDGMYTKNIARKTRMESKAISSQLKKLEKFEIIESESVGKNKIYKIKERFFNIWYLMRFGRKKDRQRVEWLIAFLNSWCSKDELENKAIDFMNKLKMGEIKESYAFHMCEALSYAGIKLETENELKCVTNKYLGSINSSLKCDLSKSDKQVFEEAKVFIDNKDYHTAIEILENSNKSSEFITQSLSILYNLAKDYSKTVKYTKLFVSYNNNYSPEEVSFMSSRILIATNNFEYSFKLLIESLEQYSKNKENEYVINYLIRQYFIELISRKQYFKAKELLELKAYNLKEKFKPIWFALMKLMEDEYPNEFKKMGSELESSVNEVIIKIEKLRNENNKLQSNLYK
ncbi:NACHT domain-containing protein [Poseidonibacter lekithochrous]|uniref:NACHT domain-containing protein n=1 Tax=Poseidonibacter lekithochrous TaxID=1904463 RepID=UPI0008FC66DD|nr:NACHT domain-containing protein [Poseidonibacter lekithochrous]QKJ22920.1 NACHT domain-containing protein [Poseidonibacter lekithochrous]